MQPPPFPFFFGEISMIIVLLYQIQNSKRYPVFPFEMFSMACLIIMLIIQVLDEYPLNVLDRLGVFGPEMNGGSDYYSVITNSPIKFWYLTGEIIETFQEIVIRMRLPILAFQRRNAARLRIQRLTIRNRILLTMIWLRRYPRLQTLASMFSVDITYVSRSVKDIIPLMLEVFVNEIKWPTANEWRSWQNHWKKFPTCVGIIDGTTHAIWRPSRRQSLFYRGDKKKHFMASHLIVTPDGMIVHCSAA